MKYKMVITCEEGDEKILVRAIDNHLLISEIDNFCRGKIKYENDFKNPEQALEEIREIIRDSGWHDY